MTIRWLTILMLISLSYVRGQDVQFSQFYSAPLFLNPALAGSEEVTRVGLNFRNQWPGLDQTFVAYSAYGDHFFENKNSGIGIIVNGSHETLAKLSNTEFGLIYSYRLQLGKESFLHMGLQGSYANRSAIFDELILSSQIDIDNGIVLPGNGLPRDGSQNNFVDLHSGLFFYNKNVWLGIAGHHLTQPYLSYMELNSDRLPVKYSAHGGIIFDIESGLINDFFNNTRQERSISFAFNYKSQGAFDQLDIGTELYLEPLILGLWYRGLPTKNGLPNNEAIIGVLGVSLSNGWVLGYSYDFTVSKLGLRNSGGSHEFSMRYYFLNQFYKKKKRVPTFKC
jgi:type IX secretion system PorP/SprF family membrane protein